MRDKSTAKINGIAVPEHALRWLAPAYGALLASNCHRCHWHGCHRCHL